MTNQKKKQDTKSKSKLFQILVGIVILAFIALMLSDLLTKKPNSLVRKDNKSSQQVYNFSKEGELTFRSAEGEFISSLDLEFADNDFERGQGLMYRTEMEENQGMLFIFPDERIQSFYMKNTVISLDMLFINSKLEIVTIHKNTEPYSPESRASSEPAQYVLETIAGYTDKFNIEVGDKVVFRQTK